MRFRPGAGLWPQLRALLLTSVLLVQCASAIPTRSLTTEQLLGRREGLRAVLVIQRLLEAFGHPLDSARVADELQAGSQSIVALRGALLAPLDPLFQWVGMQQQWSLFMVSGGIGFRIRVETRTSTGDWQLMYAANQSDRLELAPSLSYRRLRGIYNPSTRSGPRPQYEGFVSWLAAKLFREHPELQGVRVSMERFALATRERPNQSLSMDYTSERSRERRP